MTAGPPLLNWWLDRHALPTACRRSECIASRPCFGYSLSELGFEPVGGGYSRMNPSVLCVLHEYPALEGLVVDRSYASLDISVGLELFFHTPITEQKSDYCIWFLAKRILTSCTSFNSCLMSSFISELSVSKAITLPFNEL